MIKIFWIIVAACFSIVATAENMPKLWSNSPQASNFPSAGGPGVLLSWTDGNATMIFVEIPRSRVRIGIDDRPHLGKLDELKLVEPVPLAIISGGTWEKLKGAVPQPDGLVITDGHVKSNRNHNWLTGGVLLQAQNKVSIVPISSFKQEREIAEALQTSLILVRNGRVDGIAKNGTKANRVAVGVTNEAIILAGAFHGGKPTTTLSMFSEFLAEVASARNLSELTALNLDGACEAQVYIPSLQRIFSCRTSVSPTPNRIFLWEKHDGAAQR